MSTLTDNEGSLIEQIRDYARLRFQHEAGTDQARRYRSGILDLVRRLRALRQARAANTDSLLPPNRKSRRMPAPPATN